jgi:predicted dehydrogenase
MRVAFAGVGRIGAAHARVVRDHPEVDSVVLSDADAAKAQAVAVGLGVEAAESVEKGLTGADALVVAASTASHADLVLRGIREGIPVFCEKPVAPDVAGSRRVLAEVESAGAVVQIGFQRRFDHGYNAARTALREGLIRVLRRGRRRG